MKLNNKLKLSLMIQEQINCDISGVIFSNSPILKFKNYYHIEYVDNNFNDFKNNINHKILILNHEFNIIELLSKNKDVDKNHIELIRKLIDEIPKEYYPFDIEFGIKDNQIYLFQIRSITTLN